ncbi:MAG: response regulator [Bdellovibrionales bacterium]
MQPRLKLKQRVLIADYDTHFARRLADYLWDHGYEARVVQTVAEARSSVQSWQPHSVFINLILPEGNAISLIRFINSKNIRSKPQMTVMSKQTMPVALDEVRKAGVKFTLLKPFPVEEALRIVEIGSHEVAQEKKPLEAGSMRELHLLNLILRQATVTGTDGRLFNLLRMINMKADALRSSLIQWVNTDTAVVLASNDDENVRGLKLDIKNYPEIVAVKNSGRSLIIPNIRTSDVLASVQAKLQQTPFETIILFPVFKLGKFFGVLSLRMEQKDSLDMTYIEKFGEVCSHILALSIAHPDHQVFRE